MKKLILILVCIGLLSLPVISMAASEAEKKAAIQNGLAWLAGQQQAGGYWNYGGYEQAVTGAALLAFVDAYYKNGNSWSGLGPGGTTVDYGPRVANATNYLLTTSSQQSLATPNWWGFTGSNADKTGIYWSGSGEEVYTTGLVVPALADLTKGINGITPSTPTGIMVGGVNQTYAQVLQRTVDLFAWGQNGPANGFADGGWRYIVPSPNDADGSTSQWPAIAGLFAQQVAGVTVPAQMKTELQKWLNYIQNPGPGPLTGGVGYQANNSLVDESKTGGLLVQNFLAGGGGDVAKALTYLNLNWKNVANSTWLGNFEHPYAMWSIYKGLAELFGVDNMTAIALANLHTNPGDIDNPDHGWNWWEDYCNWLVLDQNPNGSWSGYDDWIGPLATAWDINILNATGAAAPPPGGEVPEPATMILLGSGLVGLAGYARKRMKK